MIEASSSSNNSFSIERVLDYLFPPKCGLCGMIGDQHLCGTCESEFIRISPILKYEGDGIRFRGAVAEYHGRGAQAVTRLKYERITSLALPMSELLLTMLKDLQLDDCDAIVPVPIHFWRRYERGFNQSELLCAAMPKDLVRHKMLRRVRRTKPQVRVPSHVRETNLIDAFRASTEATGKRIVLVDDVYTTGHTARECAKALRAAGATEVNILTFAASS